MYGGGGAFFSVVNLEVGWTDLVQANQVSGTMQSFLVGLLVLRCGKLTLADAPNSH